MKKLFKYEGTIKSHFGRNFLFFTFSFLLLVGLIMGFTSLEDSNQFFRDFDDFFTIFVYDVTCWRKFSMDG